MPISTTNSLASAIVNFLNNEEKRRKIADINRTLIEKKAKHYHMMEEMKRLYGNVLNSANI